MTTHWNLQMIRSLLEDMAASLQRDRQALDKYASKPGANKLVINARIELLDERENQLRTIGGHLVSAELCLVRDMRHAYTQGKQHQEDTYISTGSNREAQRAYNIARAGEIWDF